LLSAPNPDDPLDTGIAERWKSDEAGAIAEGAFFFGSGYVSRQQAGLCGADSPLLSGLRCWMRSERMDAEVRERLRRALAAQLQ